jgi:hypothetical protein
VFDKLKQIVLDGGEIFLCENALQSLRSPAHASQRSSRPLHRAFENWWNSSKTAGYM